MSSSKSQETRSIYNNHYTGPILVEIEIKKENGSTVYNSTKYIEGDECV